MFFLIRFNDMVIKYKFCKWKVEKLILWFLFEKCNLNGFLRLDLFLDKILWVLFYYIDYFFWLISDCNGIS